MRQLDKNYSINKVVVVVIISNNRIYNPNRHNLPLAFIFTGYPTCNPRIDPSAIAPVSSAQAQDNSQNTTPPATDNAGVPPMSPLPRGGGK